MWNTIGTNISMAEGDYGIKLPIIISGADLGANDSIKLTIKDVLNGNTIIEKDFDGIAENTVNLELTAAESALLHAGNYVYSLDWYQSGAFLCNIIPLSAYKVVDKA